MTNYKVYSYDKYKNSIFFTCYNSHGLFKIDLQAETEAKRIYTPFSMDDPYCSLYIFGDSLFIIQAKLCRLVCINLLTQEYKLFDIPASRKMIGNIDINFVSGFLHENYFYILPFSYFGIVKVELISGKVELLTDWIQEVGKDISEYKDGFFGGRYALLNDELIIPFLNSNHYLHFNFKNNVISSIEIGSDDMRFSHVLYDDGVLWFLPRFSRLHGIIKYSLKAKEIVEYNEFPSGMNKADYTFSSFFKKEDTLYIFAEYANMNIKLNVENEKMTEFHMNVDYERSECKKYFKIFCTGDDFIFFCDDMLGKMDRLSGKVVSFLYDYDAREQELKKNNDQIKRTLILNESKSFDLDSYILSIASNNYK